MIEYKDATPEVRAIYDDINGHAKDGLDQQFLEAIAHDPATLKRTWESIKVIMRPGALDPLTKELIYCRSQRNEQLPLLHRVTHGVRIQKGNDPRDVQGTAGVIGMANETNKIVTGIKWKLMSSSSRR